jgi:hypothetical protein
MSVLANRIYVYARMLATDEEICRICNLDPARLERYRGVIEKGKTEGMVSLRYERAKEVARRGAKAKGQQ